MTILTKIGVTEMERKNLILEWTEGRTSSTKELTDSELKELCNTISFEMKQRESEEFKKQDKKRKRVIAAVFGLYQKMNKKVSMDYVIGTICRRAKVDDINKIPSARLDSLYNAYLQAQKDLDFSKRMVGSWVMDQTSYN